MSGFPSIPLFPGKESGYTRDYLARGVGLLRFGANLDHFEFKPSISILARDLRNLSLALRDFTTPLQRSVREVMIPSIRENFQRGGRPPWPRLAQTTVE